MTFVRWKRINGYGPYAYRVRSVREGKKVRQVFVEYLGKGASVAPDEPGGIRVNDPRFRVRRVWWDAARLKIDPNVDLGQARPVNPSELKRTPIIITPSGEILDGYHRLSGVLVWATGDRNKLWSKWPRSLHIKVPVLVVYNLDFQADVADAFATRPGRSTMDGLRAAAKEMTRRNPDRNAALYRSQDRVVERIPKDMENRDLGYSMEAAGDILRELTGRDTPDGGYIGEKVYKVQRVLERDVDGLTERLSAEDAARADRYSKWWMELEVRDLPPRSRAARRLNIALAKQDAHSARAALGDFERLWESSQQASTP